MLGKDSANLQSFVYECRKERKKLSPENILGKIYLKEQLVFLGENIGLGEKSLRNKKKKGMASRYELAKRIAEHAGDEIGKEISYYDHELNFHNITYYGFPSKWDSKICEEPESLLMSIKEKIGDFKGDYHHILDGFTKPAGRRCELESIRYYAKEKTVSLLYSCTRVLTIPSPKELGIESYFLARIPVVVRFLYEHKLIELSIPTFYEPITKEFTASSEEIKDGTPERYQEIVRNVQLELLNITNYGLESIDFKKVNLFLETELNATDMGWQIAPEDAAEFDLKQQAIPLKEIFKNFSENLKRELLNLRIENPLEGLDLYKILRAMKEDSYTFILWLSIPLRRRKGAIFLSTQFGKQNSVETPILYFTPIDKFALVKLRQAIADSQSSKIENPYDLKTLMQQK